MIPEPLIKTEARQLGVDAMLVNLDHALGVVLWALTRSGAAEQRWIFKGGTSLRKTYFEDYRFSEDLDFTTDTAATVDTASAVVAAAASAAKPLGIHLLVEQVAVHVPREDAKGRSIELRVPFRGTLQRTGSPQVIQFHLTTDEIMVFPVEPRPLLHPYPDSDEISCEINTYALEEIVAEKLRALCGQRRFAIARDLYDVWQLAERGVDTLASVAAVAEKARCASLELRGSLPRFDARRDQFRASWESSLIHLAPQAGPEDFTEAWDAARQLVARIDSIP